jgi:hypothetical protein
MFGYSDAKAEIYGSSNSSSFDESGYEEGNFFVRS